MLYQELPSIESSPLDGWGRWLAPALIAAAGATAGLAFLLFGEALIAALFVAAGLGAAVFTHLKASAAMPVTDAPLVAGPDYALVGASLGLSPDPVALTTGEGSLLL